MEKRTPMMDQYLDIKQTCPDALLFFRLGDFYELFFDDALVASELLDLTLTGRGTGEARAPMCGVPYHAADGYIAKLISLGRRVAICEQTEDPRQVKGLVRREVIRVVTPGTSSDYFPDGDIRQLLATASLDGGQVFAAVLDSMSGEVWSQSGDPPRIEGWLLSLGVAEIVVSQDAPEPDRSWLAGLAERAGAVLSRSAARETGAKLLKSYVAETLRRPVNHIRAVEQMDDRDHLHLPASAAAHLELLQPLVPGRKGGTLLEVLDATSTAMGRRRLRAMIERPLADLGRILSRQDAVERLREDPGLRSDLSGWLRGMPDMVRIASKLSLLTANPRELLSLADALNRVPALRGILSRGTLSGDLSAQFERLQPLPGLCARIQGVLVENPPVSWREGGLLRDGVDPEVDRLRRLASGGRAFLAEIEQRERARTGIKSLKVGYNRVFGYYIEVSAAGARSVPPDYERKQTLAGAERFVTEELRRTEQEILAADDRLKALEADHFDRLLREARERVPEIQETAAAVAEIDVFAGLAEIAARRGYVRPQVDDSMDLVIEQGRHPVVESAVGPDFVPNDVRMLAGEREIALITGPNMAGKSTYMRQAALIVVMAQMGSCVPAVSARIGRVDRLFTRIGAADDLGGGASTFMVEMRETAEVLRGATRRSLILLDEIGRGTATYDGLSIAEAVIEHIHDTVFARTLFATHYHELTRLPDRLARVFNLSVAVAERGDQVVFLHQIVERPADRSYGIHVARLAGLPERVTRRAESVLRSLEMGLVETVRYEQVAAAFDGAAFDAAEIGGAAAAQPVMAGLREELSGLCVEDMTPRQALEYLFELRERVKGGE